MKRFSMGVVWMAFTVLSLGASKMPEHRLRVTDPVEVWDEAFPLGNGLLGALVWGDGQPLRISLDRTDVWDLTPVPEFRGEDYNLATMHQWHAAGRHEDLKRLYELPYHRPAPTKIPAGRIELELAEGIGFQSAQLTLSNALAEVSLDPVRRVQVVVHAERAVGCLLITLPAGEVPSMRLVAPAFGGEVSQRAAGGIGAGDLSQLGYPPPRQTKGDQWQAFVQDGAEGFHFAVYLAWREVQRGVWFGAWSIASSVETGDPEARAQERVQNALSQGWERVLREHTAWWQRYWERSALSVPDPVVERQWYLDQYKFGAASRRGAPPITLQGPWTADNGQLPPWKGDYHHDLNTQLSYWPCYSGNHLEEGLSYLDWLWATRDECVAWTQRFFNVPGLNVPMTSDLRNQQIGGWRQYTHSATTAAWLAQHFYLHWQFSRDRRFLETRAWPYLRDASVFIEAITRSRDAKGKRSLPLSSSPEIHDNRPEAWFKSTTNYDLALMRWLLEATSELAQTLGLEEEARRWKIVAGELPPLAFGEEGQLLVAPGEPLSASHRHFSHLMALHPLGLVGQGDTAEDKRLFQASLDDLARQGTKAWCGYSFAWLANMAAWARDGDRAAEALSIFTCAFTLPNSFHCNGDQSDQGYSNFRYRPFTLEGNFAAAAGLQEMLLQSHRGYIEVFPAVPLSWREASFRSLRARGAYLVSASRRDAQVREITIQSERGGLCRWRSPWSGEIEQVAFKAGEQKTFRNDADSSLAERPSDGLSPDQVLAASILADPILPQVLERAKELLRTGLNAGGGYGEVWIRDLNTFIELALQVQPAPLLRDALRTFFAFQGPTGDMPDGFIPRERGNVGYKYRSSALAPGLWAHKNTVETDQEASLVQAVSKYVRVTGDRAFLDEVIDGKSVLERLCWALEYVFNERFDRQHGLVWGATTADWGDVQPEHDWGVELDAHSHRALDVYDNAMMIVAIESLLGMLPDDIEERIPWERRQRDLREQVRRWLWDDVSRKFIPHLYLDGSPFPVGFDEESIFYHGGTAVAIEAGLLTPSELRHTLVQMHENVRLAGAGSIGLTVYPPYPEGFFKNPAMKPYGYQNGGDWCWFGGRMVRQLMQYDMVEEAYAALRPMTARVVDHGDFYEWWSRDNKPRGSNQFRGSAGVLGIVIEELLAWARDHHPQRKPAP